MCIIIDANMIHKCTGNHLHADVKPIFDWLHHHDGKVVYGGKLLDEVQVLGQARKLLVEWFRSGRAKRIREDKINACEIEIKKTMVCKSNDIHVIALARASGARLLYSEDHALRADFRNPRLISKPRGSLYTSAKNAGILSHTRSCGVKTIKIGRIGRKAR